MTTSVVEAAVPNDILNRLPRIYREDVRGVGDGGGDSTYTVSRRVEARRGCTHLLSLPSSYKYESVYSVTWDSRRRH